MTLADLDDGHPFVGEEAYGSRRTCHLCGWSWDLHQLRDLRAELDALQAGLARQRLFTALVLVHSALAMIAALAALT